MEAQLTKGLTKVIASPMITTTNNVTATIFSNTEVPYTTTNTILSNGGAAATNSVVNFLAIPTTLSITPRINSDDTITLSLAPTISSEGAIASNGVPVVNTSSVTTTRTVKNGDTMVLGGLISDTESNTRTGIPILMDLPIIGNIFRNRNRSVSDNELLIFVTPTIIGDTTEGPSAGGDGSVSP
jgi:type IV pilus assembly protein PilQ